MSDAELIARVDRSTAWVAVASFVLGSLDLISTVVCIQLWVTTADFGTATLAIALFPILDRLGGMGLGAAAIREHDPSRETLSTICWLGIAVSAAVLAVLVAARPVVGAVFGEPVIASMLAAYGVRLVIQNASVVPEALMKRELRYRELSVIRMIATGVETATKLGLAYAGEHVWCFALGPIANTCVTSACIQLRCWWWPRLVFDRVVAVRAARFVAAVSGGELVYYAYTSADYLVVGAAFGDAAVGAYRLAYELVLDVVRLVSMVTAEVAFPAFVRLADRAARGHQLIRFTRQNLIVLAPFLVVVAIEADDLLALLYGAMLPIAATAARVLCVVGALRALGFVIPPLLAGTGRARRVFVYNAIAAVVLPAAFVIAAAIGHDFIAVAWAWAAGYPIAFAALLAMALPATGLAMPAYLRAIAGIAVCAAGALVVGLGTRAIIGEPWRLAAVAIAVACSYAALLAIIERITPASIVRGFATGSATAAPVPGAAPPRDT